MRLRPALMGLMLLSLAGLGISLYLTYIYTTGGIPVCLGSGGCSTVQTSPYAWIAGIPIPMLGSGLYVLLLAMGGSALRGGPRQETWLLGLFGAALIGVLFSAYLTYLEFFVIHAICYWCVASALVMLLVFVFAILAVRAAE